jgi:hypothetical protein
MSKWKYFNTNNKIDAMRESFSEALECLFEKFPKYHTNILLGDFVPK